MEEGGMRGVQNKLDYISKLPIYAREPRQSNEKSTEFQFR